MNGSSVPQGVVQRSKIHSAHHGDFNTEELTRAEVLGIYKQLIRISGDASTIEDLKEAINNQEFIGPPINLEEIDAWDMEVEEDGEFVDGVHDLGAEIDAFQSDESDHGGDSDTPEEYIDWCELTSQGLLRIPQPVLFQMFYNLAAYHCAKAKTELPSESLLIERYKEWYSRGVYTRARFKQMLGIQPGDQDDTSQIVQLARKGNTFSYNTNYTGKYTGVSYANVVYYRDGGGNIDFGADPKGLIAKFNKATGKSISSSSISWGSPLVTASEVQMSNDLTDKEKGIMPSGKKVKLKSASRSQHFAIADMLYPNSRKGKLTWHHLSDKYKMILVDMKVHAKHGHNGGVHLWK